MRLGLAVGVAVFLGLGGAAAAQSPFGTWTRPVDQPVIRPVKDTTFVDPITSQTVHWQALHTFNPAAIVRNGKVYVLYRAEDDSGSMTIGGHVSRLGLAVSDDGIHFQQMPEPVLYPAKDAQEERESPGGVEDPRIVESPDGTYVLTYTQWSRKLDRYSVGIATSRDLTHWQKQGPAFQGALDGRYDTYKYKSAAILAERKGDRLVAAKVNGKYWMFWGDLGIRLATSDDLIHWTPVEAVPGEVKVVLKPRAGLPDSDFPEAGPPPVLTKQGIVMLYNGKNKDGEGRDPKLKAGTYAVLQAVLSADNPEKIVARTDAPVFQPQLPFEQSGQYAAGTTFSEGLVLFKGKWWMYYGCADSFVGVATAAVNP
ncbi:glycoside hydrolase family 130 protein [Terriglobus sp. TAA 43]|uniref:glycoside hydrolase family 130 protein n=1 Tax=Terriglobus sp. TAA 43 TaxID=278961 RepID=UPI001E565F94|nr:glycoside hydrolase family 130 protein [Terriglobus sp. TAA 43]